MDFGLNPVVHYNLRLEVAMCQNLKGLNDFQQKKLRKLLDEGKEDVAKIVAENSLAWRKEFCLKICQEDCETKLWIK